MKKALLIVSGILGLLAFVATFTVLIVDMVEMPTVDTTQSTSTTQTTDAATDDYWGQRLSELLGQPATAGATTTTTAKKTTTTTTKERTWFTAYTGSVTLPSKHTTSTRRETTATARKTTRTLTQSEKDMVYRNVSAIVIEWYNQYRAIQLEYIADIDAKIATQEAQKQAIEEQCEKDIEALYERFKHEFIPIATMEASLYNAYRNNIASIDRTISEFEDEKKKAQEEMAETESNLEAIIQAKYLETVEELQQSTLS